MNHLSGELQSLIENESTPDWVKEQAKLQQNLIELYPIQQSLRQQIQLTVNTNQMAYAKLMSKSYGDHLFEN